MFGVRKMKYRCSIAASGFITAVVRENDLDLLTDLFLGYLWDLDLRIHP